MTQRQENGTNPALTGTDHVQHLPSVAAIDVGSNTVRALAAHLCQDGTATVFREGSAMTALGRGVSVIGRIPPQAIAANIPGKPSYQDEKQVRRYLHDLL